ncbi:MAG: Hsp20/alpha crystallin family protein [Bacteroidaceae bacterium]|nr:Hsp20/alpha crystallin family protein [Bacteroidaceae bacterium]
MLPSVYTRNQGWLPTIFNDFFDDNTWMPTKSYGTTPAINVSEDEKEYKVEVAAPGMKKENFNVHVTQDGDLVISMEAKSDTTTDENGQEVKNSKKYLRREFAYSKFEQILTLPDHVELENISASVEDGILTIDIPKMTEEEKEKENKVIEIK